jgi:hypothetical protein
MTSLTQQKRIHYLKKFCLLFTVSVPSILKCFIKEGLQLSNLQIAQFSFRFLIMEIINHCLNIKQQPSEHIQ